MTVTPVRVNYLNNRELLAEIHKSKNSFCYYVDKQYSSYDCIVSSLNDITPKLIEEIKIKRASQLMQNQKIDQKAQGLKNNQIKITNIEPDDVQEEDIVWRVMTWDHIPLDPNRSKNPKNEEEKHTKLNFKPFKHFVKKEGEFVEVGRSHWINGLHNGSFSQDHGRINNKLAMMFMKLVDRYSQRSNWRGYCVDETTEALTQRGWLNMNEINENDMIMSYSDGDMKWSKINSIFRDDYDGLMHKLTVTGMDTLITPEHKLLTERGLVKVEHVLELDKLVLIGNPLVDETIAKYSDSLVELCGWILTEGNYEICKAGKMKCITIYQNAGPKADRIRNCLTTLNFKFSEASRGLKQLCFRLSRDDSKNMLNILPTKNLSMDFILSLTTTQRELLINTMVDGDGWRRGNNRSYCQKDKSHVDLFQALCVLSGHRTNTHFRNHISYGKETGSYTVNIFSARRNHPSIASINFHGGKRNGRDSLGQGKDTHPNQPTTYYKGKVWCPETEYGCFMARRNGTVYLTGNTYVFEMKGQALMQLSFVGLQFDESRSDNPFAYYTVTVSNAFTRVLNLEKRNQNIRDDILIMNGVSPSITRQIEDELQQKAANDAVDIDEDDDGTTTPVVNVPVAAKRGAFGRPLSKPKTKPEPKERYNEPGFARRGV